MKKNILILIIGFGVLACSNRPKIEIVDSELLAVVHTHKADTNAISKWLKPYKQTIDEAMNIPIGIADSTMHIGLPESSLGRLITDVFEFVARDKGVAYDCIVTNIGGVRDSLPKGTITLGTIYKISPFDNEIVSLQLTGKDMQLLCQQIALQGGQVTSHISMKIKDMQATDIRINGKELDTTATYQVLTNDYLSFGNDQLTALAKYTNLISTKTPLREAFISYVHHQTRCKKTINAKIKGEITIE